MCGMERVTKTKPKETKPNATAFDKKFLVRLAIISCLYAKQMSDERNSI